MSYRMVGLLSAAVLLAGCAVDAAQQEIVAAASEFVRADAERACALLAPQTLESLERRAKAACPPALAALGLPKDVDVRRAEVAGESGQVQFGDDVVFLARFPDGWRVTAAGCQRTDLDAAVPYECEVEP